MEFLSLGLQYNVPVTLDNILFLSFCIKSIASETYSNNKNKQSSIKLYDAYFQ